MDLPKEPGAERPHLSQSRVLSYLGCGWQYFLQHVEKRPRIKRARQAFGTAAHVSAARIFRRKVNAEQAAELDRVRDEFRQDLAVEMEDAELDQKEVAEFVTKPRAQDRLRREGDLVMMKFLEETAPSVSPVSVEDRVRIPLSGPYDVIVIPDVMEAKRVGDLKFGTAKGDNPDVSLQLTAEALAFAAKNEGRMPEAVYFERYTRGEEPKRVRSESKRSVADVKTLTTIFDAVAAGIQNDIFLPTGLGTWRCSYCAFGAPDDGGDGSCKFVARGIR